WTKVAPSGASPLTSATNTFAPCSMKAAVVAAPRPEAPPVTMKVFPWNCIRGPRSRLTPSAVVTVTVLSQALQLFKISAWRHRRAVFGCAVGARHGTVARRFTSQLGARVFVDALNNHGLWPPPAAAACRGLCQVL